MRIVAICGSLRPNSTTRSALAVALEGAKAAGVDTELVDLADYELPFCDARKDESTYPPGVEQLRARVREAKGVILGTPEYHGGYSGVLKNALDLMGFDEFEGKMIGLVGVSGGALGAGSALNSLRVIGRSLHAWVIPQQVSVATAKRAFGPDGRPTDERVAQKLRDLGREVARFAALHSSDDAATFLRSWEEAVPNPGGEDR